MLIVLEVNTEEVFVFDKAPAVTQTMGGEYPEVTLRKTLMWL